MLLPMKQTRESYWRVVLETTRNSHWATAFFSELMLSLKEWLAPALLVVRFLHSSSLIDPWLLLHSNNDQNVHPKQQKWSTIKSNYSRQYKSPEIFKWSCNDRKGSVNLARDSPISIISLHVLLQSRCTAWNINDFLPQISSKCSIFGIEHKPLLENQNT